MNQQTPRIDPKVVSGTEPGALRWFYGLLILHVALCGPLVSGVFLGVTPPVPQNNMLRTLMQVYGLLGPIAALIVACFTFLNSRLVLLQKLILLAVSLTGISSIVW